MQAAPTMPASTSISMKAETRLAEQSIMGSDDLSRFMSFPHTDPLPGSLPATRYLLYNTSLDYVMMNNYL